MPSQHGEQCSCRVLAAAMGLDAESISYQYCQNVLQKRWGVTCRHGMRARPEPPPTAERWQDVGKVDPVKAVLISEA